MGKVFGMASSYKMNSYSLKTTSASTVPGYDPQGLPLGVVSLWQDNPGDTCVMRRRHRRVEQREGSVPGGSSEAWLPQQLTL